MKRSIDKVERLEETLNKAHLSRPAAVPDPAFAARVMVGVRALSARAEAVSAPLRVWGRFAPVLAAASGAVFVYAVIALNGLWGDLALEALGDPGGYLQAALFGM